MKRKSTGKFVILAVILIPWLTPAGSPIITTLSEMTRSLGLSESTAKLVFTMPNLTMIITCLVGGAIVGRRISYRAQIVASTLVMAVTGTAGFFFSDFTLLLVMRALFGLAMGFITPVSSSLIFRLFTEDKRAKIVGISTASMYLGNIAYTFTGGLFGVRGWQYVYLIHILCLLPLVLVLRFLPKVPAGESDTSAEGTAAGESAASAEEQAAGVAFSESGSSGGGGIGEREAAEKTAAVTPAGKKKKPASGGIPNEGFWERFPPICIFFVMFNFVFMLLTFPMQINISFILSELDIESSTTASLVLIINTVTGALTGVIVGYITKILRRFSLLLALAVCAAGMLIASLAYDLTLLLIGSALSGAGMAMINIAVLLEVSYYVKKEHIGFYSGINMAAFSVGAFCVSAYTGLLARMGFVSARSPLMVSSVCIIPLLIMFMVFIISTNKSRKKRT